MCWPSVSCRDMPLTLTSLVHINSHVPFNGNGSQEFLSLIHCPKNTLVSRNTTLWTPIWRCELLIESSDGVHLVVLDIAYLTMRIYTLFDMWLKRVDWYISYNACMYIHTLTWLVHITMRLSTRLDMLIGTYLTMRVCTQFNVWLVHVLALVHVHTLTCIF